MTNLYTSWFNTKDTLKHEEMLECIENNSNNKYIDKIYMLNETEFKFDNPKIINIELYDQRPTYNLFFKIINRKTPNDINIISNTDIYFDDTIELVKHIADDECYALTRYDNGVHMNEDFSQDVWIFKGKIKDINGDFFLGRQACDAKIAYEIKQSGYFIDNPSLTIKSHHIHKSIRNWDLSGSACDLPHLYIKASKQHVRIDNSYLKN